MKTIIAAAAALALTAVAAIPASAQPYDHHDRGRHMGYDHGGRGWHRGWHRGWERHHRYPVCVIRHHHRFCR